MAPFLSALAGATILGLAVPTLAQQATQRGTRTAPPAVQPSMPPATAGRQSAPLPALPPASQQAQPPGLSIDDALAQAYLTNPTLDAQRAQLRATDEQVPQALSNYRPTVQGTASYGMERFGFKAPTTESGFSANERGHVNPASIGVQIAQPVFRGGRTVAQTRQAENLVQAQRATLVASEVNVLLSVGQAFIDVVQAQSVVDLNRNNEQVLTRQLQADRDRFNVGEITRTDVSQSESRLSRATADRIQAEGNLASVQATYGRIVGSPPGRLAAPAIRYKLPASLDETVALAQNNNPQIVAAQFTEAAAQDTINLVQGELYPQASLNGSVTRSWNSGNAFNSGTRTDISQLQAQVTVPLYTAGSVASRVREAKQTTTQRRVQIDETRRQIVSNAVSAWQSLVTARASIISRQAQVRAADIALQGTRQENQVGSRTVLDVLNAEQELLNSQVQLVQSQHDEVVAIFQVLAAAGQLTAQNLGLKVPLYDYEAYYRQVRDKWWGLSVPTRGSTNEGSPVAGGAVPTRVSTTTVDPAPAPR